MWWQLSADRWTLDLDIGLELELHRVHGQTLAFWVLSQTGDVLWCGFAAIA